MILKLFHILEKCKLMSILLQPTSNMVHTVTNLSQAVSDNIIVLYGQESTSLLVLGFLLKYFASQLNCHENLSYDSISSAGFSYV